MLYEIKCRKCRKLIIQDLPGESRILNAHGSSLKHDSLECESLNEDNLVFLSQDLLPDWIIRKIEEVEWTRGRLNCPHCDLRIGAFDYVSGSKCICKEKILPAVHIIRSKVDLVKTTIENDKEVG